MKTRQLRGLIAAGVVVALGMVTAVWYTRSDKTGTVAPSAAKGERKILYWADPMTPGFKSDKPGKSPFMDMELVPVYEDEAGATIVSVRPEIVQNLGVRTYTVTRGSQPRRVAVTGYLFRDARGLAALVDLIDRDASFVRVGQRAEVRVADAPDRTWGGTVEKVESDVDIGARTVKARIRLSQTSAVLKPNMFAEVAILGTAVDKQALFVPREALIRTGTRNAVVLALGSGRFQPVAVTPGVESDDWIEIRHGIKEGDVVVTSGQFLIDSEASVRASFSRMQSAEPGTAGESKTPAGGAHTGH
jgi:Cu(I)/Ag(I) efflux system membrane fusion protein